MQGEGTRAVASKVAGAAAKQESRPGTRPRPRHLQGEERVEWAPQPALPARSTSTWAEAVITTGVTSYYARQPLFAVQKHLGMTNAKNLVCPAASYRLTNSAACTYTCTYACTSMLLHDTMMADGRCQIMGNPHDDTTMQVQLLVRCQCGSFQHGLVKQAGRLPCLSGAAFHPFIHFPPPPQACLLRPGQAKSNQIRQTHTHGREAAVGASGSQHDSNHNTPTNEALRTASQMLIGILRPSQTCGLPDQGVVGSRGSLAVLACLTQTKQRAHVP